MNNVDRSYVGLIKQVNWNYSDAAVQQPASGIKTSSSYRGCAVPNKLSSSRIQDMKGVHFEIGSRSHIDKLNSINQDTY